MSKSLILNRMVLALCIGAVLLAIVPITGCTPTPEAPPVYLLQWGSQGTSNGQFEYPHDVAVDTAGNVYVSDINNNRIQKFSGTGAFVSQWGGSGSGNGQFNGPAGIAVDTAGNVYVVDTNNSRIQKFSGAGAFLTKWGSFGFGSGQFDYPRDVAVDSAGNIFVVDTANRVQKLNSTGAFVTQWGSSGSSNGQFNGPQGVAVDAAGNVYITDTENYRVQKFSGTGAYLTQWGSSGSGNGQFNGPHGIAVDAAGHVYVTDAYNNRVEKFDGNGGYLTQWGISGTGNGQFKFPTDVAVDTAGNVYVADMNNYRIQKFGKSSSPGEATLAPTGPATRVPAGTIDVNAMLDGSPWPGSVSFTLTGPSPISGSSVPQTYDDMPPGTYTIAYNSGGPNGATFVNTTSSATQALIDGTTTTFTLNFRTKAEVRTGTINIDATLNGVAGTGAVNFTITGPSPVSGSSAPQTYSTMPAGTYTVVYNSGGPSGASFVGVTPSATQVLTAGGITTFTLNFTSKTEVRTGTIIVNAVLDNSPGQGVVSFTLSGPSPISGSSAPQTYSTMPAGTYTIVYNSGGPSGASFVGVTPTGTQTLTAGGTTVFTLKFTTKKDPTR